MHRAGLVRLVRMGLVYLLVAAAAALGWLWHALPEEICLEPGQTLQLPRFAWVEPLRGRGSRNVASTRAVGSYQVTLALGGWLPVPRTASSPPVSAAQLHAGRTGGQPEYARYEGCPPARPARSWIHRYPRRTSDRDH